MPWLLQCRIYLPLISSPSRHIYKHALGTVKVVNIPILINCKICEREHILDALTLQYFCKTSSCVSVSLKSPLTSELPLISLLSSLHGEIHVCEVLVQHYYSTVMLDAAPLFSIFPLTFQTLQTAPDGKFLLRARAASLFLSIAHMIPSFSLMFWRFILINRLWSVHCIPCHTIVCYNKMHNVSHRRAGPGEQ